MGAVSCPGKKKEGALRVRRQREDESGLENLHDGLAEEARSPGSCASSRAERLSPDPPTQVERCVLLKSVTMVLLDCGEFA